jgi:circadian clock protein KaiB
MMTSQQDVALEGEAQAFVLRLYVSGSSPRSIHAVKNMHAICERHLEGRYRLDVIDIYQQPALAAAAQIVVTPTLVKEAPAPVRLLVGTLANMALVLDRLGLSA